MLKRLSITVLIVVAGTLLSAAAAMS